MDEQDKQDLSNGEGVFQPALWKKMADWKVRPPLLNLRKSATSVVYSFPLFADLARGIGVEGRQFH